MKFYLAGGIYGLGDGAARDWRAQVTTLLAALGHTVADPMRRDYRGKERGYESEIVNGDIADIAACDALFAMCLVPSWGTAMELRIAYTISKPVIVVGPEDCSPWLRYHATAGVYPTIERACDEISVGLRRICTGCTVSTIRFDRRCMACAERAADSAGLLD